MFIIEKLTDDHHRRVEEWLETRRKWLAQDSWRTEREYAQSHPRPGHWIKGTLKTIGIIHIVLLVISIIVTLAIHTENKNKNQPKPSQAVVYEDGVKCGEFKVGDIAQIQYGDYEGAEVKIISGCADADDYQVVTTKDQTLFALGSKNEQLNDVYVKEGLTLKVNANRNLVVIGHDKGEKNGK